MQKLLTCLFILCILSFVHTAEKTSFLQDVDPLQNKVLQQEQKKIQDQQEKKKLNKFHKWVVQQLIQFEQAQQIITRQTFSFQLDKTATFRWSPSKNGDYRIMVQVIDSKEGNIFYPINPDQDQFVSLQVKDRGNHEHVFSNIGNTYIHKVFHIFFRFGPKLIRLNNHYGRKMLVQIGLQDSGYTPESGIKDDILQFSNQKMNTIMEELKQTQIKRQKLYKSQAGFQVRQERHQSQMLVLTGVQLIFILGTSIIQLYCIKNLLQNRSII